MRLDERGAVARTSPRNSLRRHLVYSQQIVAINGHTGHPVSRRACGQIRSCRLNFPRRRDGPLVVLQEEDDRRFHDTGKVCGLVKVAFRRRAFSEESDRDPVLPLHLHAPAEAYRAAVRAAVRGDFDQAVPALLELLTAHREWRDGAVRKTLVDIFRVLDDDPRLKTWRGEMARRLH